jgi:alkylation response protein AidB-like acyl-CoA dehydrogenase
MSRDARFRDSGALMIDFELDDELTLIQETARSFATERLGPQAREFEANRALARARLYVTALLVGVMRASADFSRAYARERVAFGRPQQETP